MFVFVVQYKITQLFTSLINKLFGLRNGNVVDGFDLFASIRKEIKA